MQSAFARTAENVWIDGQPEQSFIQRHNGKNIQHQPHIFQRGFGRDPFPHDIVHIVQTDRRNVSPDFPGFAIRPDRCRRFEKALPSQHDVQQDIGVDEDLFHFAPYFSAMLSASSSR